MALPTTVRNITITGSGTEDTYTPSADVYAFTVRPRTNGVKMRTTAAGAYFTIPSGEWRRQSAIMTQQPFYFEGTGGADVLEIVEELGPVLP